MHANVVRVCLSLQMIVLSLLFIESSTATIVSRLALLPRSWPMKERVRETDPDFTHPLLTSVQCRKDATSSSCTTLQLLLLIFIRFVTISCRRVLCV